MMRALFLAPVHPRGFREASQAEARLFFPKTTPLASFRRGTSPRPLLGPTNAPSGLVLHSAPFFFEDKRLNGSGKRPFYVDFIIPFFLASCPLHQTTCPRLGSCISRVNDASFSCQATRKTYLSNPAQPQYLIGMEKGNHVLLHWRISNQNMC